MKPLKPLYKVLYYIVYCIGQVIVRPFFPVRSLGHENLTGIDGYVLAPNHVAAIDPLFVLMARGNHRKMLIMGKGELFGKNPLLDFFWALAGAFPVERGTGQRSVVDDAMEEVKAGRSLLIFPEGTRTKTGQLGRLKSGAFVVAQGAGAAMVPCFVHYKAGRPKIFHRCTIVFGKPMTPAELGMEGEYSPARLREAKKLFSAAIEGLREAYKDRL